MLNDTMFYNLQTSLLDHPDMISVVVYTRYCNWSCWGCHNMKALLKNKNVVNYTTDDIIEVMKNPITDLLVISGGESLSQGDEFINVLRYLREKIDKPIRLDTNGSFPELVRKIKDENLVDGFAVDVKFPYWIGDHPLLHKITGMKELNTDDLLETMRLADGMPYTIFRTVEYPILPKDLLNEIKEHMKENYVSPHTVNPYYTLNG